MPDLVVISLEPWDEVWRRNQHLLARLLNADETLRVLFVEPVADPLDAMRRTRTWPRRGRGLRGVEAGDDLTPSAQSRLWLWQDTKWLPRRLAPGWDAAWARRIVRQAGGLRLRTPVLWVNDPRGSLVMRATGWPTLYDITDDWVVADRPAREQARILAQEADLLRAADTVVVCSPELMRRKSGAAGRLYLVGNAVDMDLYQNTGPRPKDLPSGQIALYAGTVHPDRVDLLLLEAVADQLKHRTAGPTATLVLVGPCLLPQSRLRELGDSGVVILGPRPAADIPAYLKHADVLLVPHVETDFTASLDPIKAYEYRAAGTPVVSTPVAGFVDVVDPLVTVCSAEDFPATVLDVLERPKILPRAQGDVPTWDERATEMERIIAELEGGLR